MVAEPEAAMSDTEKKSLLSSMKGFLSNDRGSGLDSEDKLRVNESINRRNSIILFSLVIVLLAAVCGYMVYTKKQKQAEKKQVVSPTFGTVIDPTFTAEDAQSAGHMNASDIRSLTSSFKEMESKFNKLSDKYKDLLSDRTNKEKELKTVSTALDKVNRELEQLKNVKQKTSNTNNFGAVERTKASSNSAPSSSAQITDEWVNNTNGNFVEPNDPTRNYLTPQSAKEKSKNKPRQYQPTTSNNSIDTFVFTSKSKGDSRSYKNYVPSGSWVTAVLTGGAEANAGVSGQSSTATVTFRFLNDGYLPNGYHSKLKNCFMTGSAYGDISSQRGIVRGDRMSCIKKDGSILDIPVEATVFNFGKMGIRGEVIMRNSKIMQTVGISALFDGISDGITSSSETTSTSALGSTSTVSSVGLNMLGSMGSSAAEKFSDYYIKLAEQYHPDIDLHSGAVVNIVFLKGFPLEGNDVDKYSKKVDSKREESSGNTSVSAMTSSPLQIATPSKDVIKRGIQ